MPENPSTLARRYRRLLLAYPRRYRECRGAEIVDTLLDQADAGHTRPTVREARNLLGHGLRARLGRPASRSVVAWAALTALLCGLFSAAAATWVAWQTARPLPDRAEASAIFDTALPGRQLGNQVGPAEQNIFEVYGEPLRWSHADDLLLGDGGEYQLNTVGTGLNGPTPADYRSEVEGAAERLRAAGWDVVGPYAEDAVECGVPACANNPVPQQLIVTARRGDTVMELSAYSDSDAESTYLYVELTRAAPWVVWPAGIVGGLLGGLAGWLVFGWASRRTDGRHVLTRIVANTLYGVTLFFWGMPAMFGAIFSVAHHIGEPHLSWHPMWEWLGQPVFSLLFLVGCLSAVLGLAAAALPRRRTSSGRTGATA